MPARIRTFKNANTPHSPNKGKGRIIKIDWKEHEQEIKRIWEGKPPDKLVARWKEQGLRSDSERYYFGGTKLARMSKIKNLVDVTSNLPGHCCACGDLDTHLVKYRTQGITIIERYCNEHVPNMI